MLQQYFLKRSSEADSLTGKYRLFELYSGIGGMRFALDAAGISYEIVAAVDINPVVNDIYCHNFGKRGHSQRNILSYTTAEIENMNLDLITMSPPCQPFTRVGLKKDDEDARSSSFLHILNVITELRKKPSYVILENVKGFEESQTRDILICTLKKCGYFFQEFLLSPSSFGIPNSRLRYYLIAKLDEFSFPVLNEIHLKMPKEVANWSSICCECSKVKYLPGDSRCLVKHFLEDIVDDDFCISDQVLQKYWTVFDIVHETSYNTCCFTKAYKRYAQGTGSVLATCGEVEAFCLVQNYAENGCGNISDKCKPLDAEQLERVKKFKLRYFTPKEIANIMCFPKKFNFPPNVTVKQKYRSIGNSLNVFVVACLMHLLFEI